MSPLRIPRFGRAQSHPSEKSNAGLALIVVGMAISAIMLLVYALALLLAPYLPAPPVRKPATMAPFVTVQTAQVQR